MSFFIPGRTKCGVCQTMIEHREDAAQLPFVDPTALPSLAQLARSFVHRTCWAAWSEAEQFSKAAFHLACSPPVPNPAMAIEAADDLLLIFRIDSLKSFRLQDFAMLVTIDIPGTELTDFIAFLSLVSEPTHSTAQRRSGGYLLEGKGMAGAAELTFVHGSELVERVTVPAGRLKRWIAAVQDIARR